MNSSEDEVAFLNLETTSLLHSLHHQSDRDNDGDGDGDGDLNHVESINFDLIETGNILINK